jgi:hypothetical protein
MADERFPEQYGWKSSKLISVLEKKADSLWDDVWNVKENLYEPHCRIIPEENLAEAERRAWAIKGFIKRNPKTRYSNLQVKCFVRNLKSRAQKLQVESGQIAMDFMATTKKEEYKELEQIRAMIEAIASLSRTPDYFEVMYWSTR